MKLLNKQTFAAIAIVLMLLMTASIAVMPAADAHTPAWTIPTFAYLEVTPNPIGVNQTGFIIMWIDKVPPTAGGIGGYRWQNYKLTITKPDGTTQVLGPYMSDATSSAFITFTPDQLGEYDFLFEMPQQNASANHPVTGIPPDPSLLFYGALDYVNDTYLASSATYTLTVQEEPVAVPPTYPLPTEYWTRPIEAQNTAWVQIASNYLRGGANPDRIQPNGIAPNSPHILWAKPYADGGIVGGSYDVDVSYYSGLSYEGRFGNPIILYGRLYYDTPLSDSATAGPYTCVDLRTGQTLWTNDAISPTFGQLYLYESFNQHGVIGDGYLWQVSGTTWMAYDPRTGRNIFNMTNVPSGYGPGFLGGYGSGALGPSGEIVIYNLNVAGNWIALWNSSAHPLGPLVLTAGNGTNAFQYRPVGKSANMSTAYTWNATITNLPSGMTNLTTGSNIIRAIPGDLAIGSIPAASFLSFGTPNPYIVWAISLKKGQEGRLLWLQSYAAPSGNITRSIQSVDPESRVFTMVDKETMQWSAYDLDSGDHLWGPTGTFRDFQYYGIVSHPPAPAYNAYGNVYVGGYGGEIVAFDARTGAEVWRYNNTFSGTETPWGYYPLYISAIADGKIYAYTGEHSPNAPPYKGARVRCINATTGEEIWTLLSWQAIGSFGEEAVPVADGYIAYLNVYDMQIYTIGKGPSATTVTAPMAAVEVGQKFTITGTVTDQSAGAKGTAAIADESMGPWMEYLYMQKPMPADAKGVTVKLTAIDSNNNLIEIGEATSDTKGNFGFTWTPEVPGLYQIIATFAGSESYFSSYATTYLSSVEAPIPSPTPEPISLPPTEMYIGVGTGLIIVAIAIVGLVLFRKH